MIDWAERARARLAQAPDRGDDKTDKTPLSSVSSVPGTVTIGDRDRLSSVSSVPPRRASGKCEEPSLPPAGCVPPGARVSGNPYLTPEQFERCHEGCWSGAEIATFVSRSARFVQLGRSDAEHLAEVLTLRDRQGDDRRMCLECRELEESGRCAAARRGALVGADRNLEPMPAILTRCEGFRPYASNYQACWTNEHVEDDRHG